MEKDRFDKHLPVVVSADPPDTDAADWLRVEQAAIIGVHQSQHAVLKLKHHAFTLKSTRKETLQRDDSNQEKISLAQYFFLYFYIHSCSYPLKQIF